MAALTATIQLTRTMTREELHKELDAAGVPMDGQIAAHYTKGDRPGEIGQHSLSFTWHVQ